MSLRTREKTMKNIFTGPDAVKNYLDMGQHEPTSCVEVPPTLATFPEGSGIRLFLKMMGPEAPLNTFKIVPVSRWFAEQYKKGLLKKGVTTVVISSSGGAALAAVPEANAYGVKIIVIMPADAPTDKQTLVRRAMKEDYGELILNRESPGKPTGVELARQMGERENFLTFDQYGDDINWQAHADITIAQIFEQMNAAELKVGGIVVAMGSTGTLLGAREFCKEHSPDTLVVGVMAEEGEPIPAVRTEHRLRPTQILFDWKTGTYQVKVARYESYQKTAQALRHGFKVGLSAGAAIVGAERFASDSLVTLIKRMPQNSDGSRILVVVVGDILDPYLEQLRVILDPHDL
jgi:cysteine synthase